MYGKRRPRGASRLRSAVAELEGRKLLLREQLAGCDKPIKEFDESFRTALQFLASPWNLWKSDKLTEKRIALKLTFPSQLAYDRKTGFRTPILALPFNMLGDFSMLEKELARPERFERPTLRFVVPCYLLKNNNFFCKLTPIHPIEIVRSIRTFANYFRLEKLAEAPHSSLLGLGS